MPKTTVHLICKAHIDPVWLWPWTAGLDEILNTCATACDLLDRNPDVVFTRGEAWVYEQIEKIDPVLFDRIRAHVRDGRWEVTGGWYIQPDCNLPHAEGFRRQIALGRDYFLKAFGTFPRIGFNPDSFGHASLLPDLMHEAGQRGYVMMRPQEHELDLPARLFRWRGRAGGPEVLTFRIAGAYHSSEGMSVQHIEESLTRLPTGVRHTMCFVGIGDHGGGPTQDMIDWCHDHRHAIPGAVLKFSSPSRFFRAVARSARQFPVVTGELQYHAIGCYSVQHSAKVGVRRAEHALIQAEEALRMEPDLRPHYESSLREAWRWLCFNHFHDTLGGTCLPSTYPQMDAQLGLSQTTADEILALTLRRRTVREPACTHQRLFIGNQTGADFDGWIEHEPWLEWTRWKPDWGLVDERNRPVPFQVMDTEDCFSDAPRLLFKLAVKRGADRTLRLVGGMKQSARPGPCAFTPVLGRGRTLRLKGADLSWKLPELHLLDDHTDTWSHGVDRFREALRAKANWGRPRRADNGPLLCAWCVEGRIGRSHLAAEIRRYTGEAFIEVRLRVTWLETHRLLRLSWPQPSAITHRLDGVAGGSLRRASDGQEKPVHDRTLLKLDNGFAAGAVFPDVFSLSGTRRELRLTLLRSPVMAHHPPHNGEQERRVISDQGVHTFTFRFYPRLSRGPLVLDRHALSLHRRPGVTDLTRGMPQRPGRNEARPRPL